MIFTEKFIEKLRNVLDIFYQNHTEILLLWSPQKEIREHLNKCDRSVRESYLQIVESYQKQAWGCYDETLTWQEAVIVCDAYYGDPCDWCRKMSELGRSVMIQAVEIL